MRLHELVYLRNELSKALDLSTIRLELEKNSNSLKAIIEERNHRYTKLIENIADRHIGIINQVESDYNELTQIIESINKEITRLSQKFFEKDYQDYLKYSNPENIRTIRKLPIPDGVDIQLVNRINLYSEWKYPGLEIGCRDGDWTKYLVASDPLYVADVFTDFLDSAKLKFPPEYQVRLRAYPITEHRIEGLPIGQFGFIFSYNFFNYLSIDTIRIYLSQALEWLRPGGTILFTYNNGDMSACAAYAENYYMSYVPKSVLVPLCESMGFEVTATQEFEPAVAWIELKKPGVLKTVKAHQALGEIKRIKN